MPYENLHELITGSMSSRNYFLSLPVELQMRLHEQDGWIHTAQELHRAAENTKKLMWVEEMSSGCLGLSSGDG